jgi:SAM-dependent methyltransferase
MSLNSPISDSKLIRLIDIVELTPESRAIDFGCGNGEFLIRLNEASNATCLGVDIDESLIAAANAKLSELHSGRVEFRQSDVATLSLDPGTFDLSVCMGSSHAFSAGESAYGSALEFMQEILKPNGMILIGEGYWKKKPDPEYLDFLGDPVGVYNSFEENIAIATAAGLVPVYATESNLDEWDHFEWSFLLKAERDVISNPDDETANKKLERVREWNAFYRLYGRSTMGYGHYIFMKK